MNYKELIIECYSVSDFCKKIGFTTNGRDIKKAKSIIIDENLDISHFDNGSSKKMKYPIIEKECPVCKNLFKTQKDRNEKVTCSHSCSNTFFRSGENHPNWKEFSNNRRKIYRDKCFFYHKEECVICGENKIVEVHHLDENRNNNNIDNLIPLCPTHHRYWHSKYKDEIVEIILEYQKIFRNGN